jgi:hypothetical protein
MMGPIPDRSGGASGHREHTGYVAVPTPEGVFEAPPPPPQLDDDERVEWGLLFQSGYAQGVRAVWGRQDWPVVYRLFELRHEYRMQFGLARDEPVVTGSGGSEVLNPRARWASDLLKAIRDHEKALALDPMSRARLGVKVLVGQTLARRLEREGANPPEHDSDATGSSDHFDL